MLLAEIVGAAKGQTVAQALLEAWRGEVADVVSYAQGQGASASADLDRKRSVIAAQVALGDLSTDTADELVRQRFAAEVGLADAVATHDTTGSVSRVEALVASSDALGGPLAAAMAAQLKDLAPTTSEGLDVDLRVHLTSALQAHVYLTGLAVSAAADGRAAEAQAYSDLIDSSAQDPGAQFGALYGAELGTRVASRLQAESAAFVAAGSGGDRRQAAADIDRFRAELDVLLSGANQLLPSGLVNQQLRASDQPLLTAADAFAVHDFVSAYARLRESARQIHKPAETLAAASIDRYPGRYIATPTLVPTDESTASSP